MKRLCVYCGSSPGNLPEFNQAARDLGRLLATTHVGVVYGGGNVGLMGVLADATLQAGGEVVGVIPQSLVDRELAHPSLTRLHVVGTMHERKALMVELSHAFLALPGGFGTLDELCEVLTWAQLGFHKKPIALLNTAGFYAPFLAQIHQAREQGFTRPDRSGLLEILKEVSAVETWLADIGLTAR